MGRFTPTTASVSSGEQYPNRVVYDTPGTYTFTVPADVKKIKTTVIGGGGAGFEGVSQHISEDIVYHTMYACCNRAEEGYDYSGDSGTATCLNLCIPQMETTFCNRWSFSNCAYAGGVINASTCFCSTNYCSIFSVIPSNYGSKCYTETVKNIAVSGASGGYAHKEIKVVPGAAYNVVVGDAEGTSSFGTEVSATGGSTTINRCYNVCAFLWDVHCVKDNTNGMCRCTGNIMDNIFNTYFANTTCPQFYPSSLGPAAGCHCVVTCGTITQQCALMRPLKMTSCFINGVTHTPGQGIGGDVNKAGADGACVTYDFVPRGINESRGDFSYCISYCTYHNTFCAFNSNWCECILIGPYRPCNSGCDRHYTMCAPYTCYGTCQACCHGPSYSGVTPCIHVEDMELEGAKPATEYTTAYTPCYEVYHMNSWMAPWHCRRNEKERNKFDKLFGLAQMCNQRGCLSANCVCSFYIAGASTDHETRFVTRHTIHRFTDEDKYMNFWGDFTKYSAQGAMMDLVYGDMDNCICWYERLDNKTPLVDRLYFRSTFCMCCYDASAPHANNETYVYECAETGKKHLVPSSVCFDYMPLYSCGSAELQCVCYTGGMTTCKILQMGIANNHVEASEIIENTKSKYAGNVYDTILREDAIHITTCSDAAGTCCKPGFICTSGNLFAPIQSYQKCVQKAVYYDHGTSGETLCRGSNNFFSCNCALSGGQNNVCSGTCVPSSVWKNGAACQLRMTSSMGEMQTLKMCLHVPAMQENIPWRGDFENPFPGGACFSDSELPSTCTHTYFYSACYNKLGAAGGNVSDTCYKEVYNNAGQGGVSSWHKEFSKGKPGLVVVCY